MFHHPFAVLGVHIPLFVCLIFISALSIYIGMELFLYSQRLKTITDKIQNWDRKPITRARLRLRLDELSGLQEGRLSEYITSLLQGEESLLCHPNIHLSEQISTPKITDGRIVIIKSVILAAGIFGSLLGNQTSEVMVPALASIGMIWVLSNIESMVLQAKKSCIRTLEVWIKVISTPLGTFQSNMGGQLDEGQLQNALKSELQPILQKILDINQDNADQTTDFLSSISEAQVSGVTALINQVQTGIEDRIGTSLTQATDDFKSIIEIQKETITTWKGAVSNVSDMLLGMQNSTRALQSASEQINTATTPITNAAVSFSQVSEQLRETMGLFEAASSSYSQANIAIQQAHSTLQRGTEAYLQAGADTREMITELKETHSLATARISEGVDEAILSSMREAGAQLLALQTQQTNSLQHWQSAAEQLHSAVSSIQLSTSEMSNVATVLRESSEPTVAASEAFLQAAQKLSETMPQIGQAAQAHEHARQAMETTATLLSESSLGYKESTRLIQGAIDGFQEAQIQTMSHIQESLESHVTTALQEAAQSVRRASENFESQSISASEHLHTQILSSCSELLNSTQVLKEQYNDGNEIFKTSMTTNQREFEERFIQMSETQIKHMSETSEQLGQTLTSLSTNLKSLSLNQAEQSTSLSNIMSGLGTGLESLETSTHSLGTLIEQMQALAEPTNAAAKDFKEASMNITAAFPSIKTTSESYNKLNDSLSQAAIVLSNTTDSYIEAGDNMTTLLEHVQSSMTLQVQSNKTVSSTLDSAATTIQSFAPLAEQLQAASGNVLEISSQTAKAVEIIREATNAQQLSANQMEEMAQHVLQTLSNQAKGLDSFSEHIHQLHHTLTAGVDAFSTALPQSVDHTLLRFDVALGEGVARLGSAVERLREAMDDLIERVETMLDTRRRK